MQGPALVALALAPAFAPTPLAAGSPQDEARRPNFLVIVCDDFGVDALSCYGVAEEPPTTPRLDALAARGLRFTRAWVTPICSSTRALLQTGRHGFRTGVGSRVLVGDAEGHALPLSEVTLPEMLDAGTDSAYAHAAFGKWHLGNDSVGGYEAAEKAGYDVFSGARTRGPRGYFTWRHVSGGARTERSGYVTTATANDALAWMESADAPWLCYLAFHAPHAPLHEPPAELHGVDLDAVPPGEGREQRAARDRLLLSAMIEALDTEIGRVLDELGDALSSTFVFVIGDNGTKASVAAEPFGIEHAKGSLYEGGVLVPFLVAGPGVEPGVCDALVHGVDLFATVAELAGVDLTRALEDVAIDGRSLVPFFSDADAPSRREVLYTELFEPNGFGPYAFHHRAIRDERFKLLTTGAGEELYDLALDPWESRNLLTPDASEEVRRAAARLRAAQARYVGEPGRR